MQFLAFVPAVEYVTFLGYSKTRNLLGCRRLNVAYPRLICPYNEDLISQLSGYEIIVLLDDLEKLKNVVSMAAESRLDLLRIYCKSLISPCPVRMVVLIHNT